MHCADNIGVRFFEEAADGTVIWESSGLFGASDIHKQVEKNHFVILLREIE